MAKPLDHPYRNIVECDQSAYLILREVVNSLNLQADQAWAAGDGRKFATYCMAANKLAISLRESKENKQKSGKRG